MNYYAWTEPTARKRHRCENCYRAILPGEQYRRCAGLGDGEAWTYKTCEHCYRVSAVWASQQGEYDWDNDCILEWLEESHPAKYSSLLARWRYPDGEIMPLPFVRHWLLVRRPDRFRRDLVRPLRHLAVRADHRSADRDQPRAEGRLVTRRWRVFRVVTGWWSIPSIGPGAHCHHTWRQAIDHALRDGSDQ